MVIIYSFCSVFISNFSLACHNDIAIINVVCSSPCKFNGILQEHVNYFLFKSISIS